MSNRVKKIVITSQSSLPEYNLGGYGLPEGYEVQDTTFNPATGEFSILIASDTFPQIEAGDLFYYAPVIPLAGSPFPGEATGQEATSGEGIEG